ncbi:MAG TPA: Spy/CpxP family protein refolding chaperone [Burkholderiaceae bacterium]|nr:Spy/CpxP family protein refolding chaperone [Burkholderiaceae bacterium]HMZ00881.1 Spy/CpxP family protein refolding chaperone [Burkholderiaceae bacterium]HNB45628.1 Spy/CpxP family protein refolding chaperone [Burkholderiaceae bacterium]HNG80657.1 Spy/CpxP family protein refolding chaperone [Burkholderiaceae bacterium]
MKPWFKRSLFGIAAIATVAGLSACGHGPMGGGQPGDGPAACGPMGMGMQGGPMMGLRGGPRGPMSDADAAKMRDRMVARATQELSLDDAQKAKLVTLLDTMHQQRSKMMGAPAAAGQPPKAPREAFLGLMKGERFDRAGAQALADEKTGAMRAAAPELITAMGNFYDSLKPEQQAKVRDFLAQGGPGRGMGRHGWHRG